MILLLGVGSRFIPPWLLSLSNEIGDDSNESRAEQKRDWPPTPRWPDAVKDDIGTQNPIVALLSRRIVYTLWRR